MVRSSKEQSAANPWTPGSAVATALETFASRLEDPVARKKLEELRKEVGAVLGPKTVETSSGVFNAARLYRYLCINEMDVQDAKEMTTLIFNARIEFKMDEKRRNIIKEDLSYDTIPRFNELASFQQINNFVGRANDGRVVNYVYFGGDIDFEGAKQAFTKEEYLELVIMAKELTRMLYDAFSAIEGKSECATVPCSSLWR